MRLDSNTSYEVLTRLIQAISKKTFTLADAACAVSLGSLDGMYESKHLCNVYAKFNLPDQNRTLLSIPICYYYLTSRENVSIYQYEVPKTWSWADIVEDMLEKTVQGMQFSIFGNSLDMSTDSIYAILIDIDLDNGRDGNDNA